MTAAKIPETAAYDAAESLPDQLLTRNEQVVDVELTFHHRVDVEHG